MAFLLTSIIMLRISSPPLQARQEQFDTCSYCNDRLNKVESFLDTRNGKPVRIFKCTDCQKFTWDD
ncbi:hypothetical protein SAMN05192541_1716 [Bradyrhizobium arachidis]|uniref:Uncharacterized protein n=2 Tax=Bradyrhizobium arachidis TaxID=858423 RepID=A0AAE7NN07_9BRAD|nr:hypothetical protein WN72_13260 [Bradyrhizobium arachidis]SFV19876.1 hypothetical protein SAMN05192541_1716 [Bradyrhizobium arachidis]